MDATLFTRWVFPSLLVSLRVAPVFTFAPPFTLIRTPALFRVLLAVGVAACLVSARPAASAVGDMTVGRAMAAAARELFLGMVFALAFQLAFGALQTAGRTIDIQAGYGLAVLIDPSTQAQTPLIGSLFTYAAGAVFFAIGGHAELLRLLAASLDAIPIGQAQPLASLGPLAGLCSSVFALALGVAGGMILCLFLADLAIAAMSRTIPQMNVLVLGLQAKTLATLLILPVVIGGSGGLLLRLLRTTLDGVPGLIR